MGDLSIILQCDAILMAAMVTVPMITVGIVTIVKWMAAMASRSPSLSPLLFVLIFIHDGGEIFS